MTIPPLSPTQRREIALRYQTGLFADAPRQRSVWGGHEVFTARHRALIDTLRAECVDLSTRLDRAETKLKETADALLALTQDLAERNAKLNALQSKLYAIRPPEPGGLLPPPRPGVPRNNSLGR